MTTRRAANRRGAFYGICGDALDRARAELTAWGSEKASDGTPEISIATSDARQDDTCQSFKQALVVWPTRRALIN
jgi:hypothetical protein